MRSAVYNLLREAQQKMSGYAVYMNYQFIHFSVVAEPAALLAVEVEIDNTPLNLEDVADVAVPEDTQFALIPKDQSYLFPICKAVGKVHPDYKIEQKPLNEENEDSDGASSHSEGQDSDEEKKYVLCTMPAVNKDRRDAGMDYVKTVYEETMSQLDTVNAAYTAKISKLLINAKPEELDEAKDELKKLHDNHVDICKNYRDEKETQLEEAYQKYLQAESEKESAEQEKQAARGQDAGKQMSMDAWATEEE